MIEFQEFPKIARLNRDIVITEKIDGTNAAIGITKTDVYAQSRSRIITPDKDNFGFARWVADHAAELHDVLGHGLHFGEWWGLGIQRGYGLQEKRFSLFNTARWGFLRSEGVPWSIRLSNISSTPVLYEGPFSQDAIKGCIERLRKNGSQAAPGFDRPEGVVIYHTATGSLFKVTLEKDDKPKGAPE